LIAALALLAAGGLATLAVVLAGVGRVIALTDPIPLRVLIAAPALMALGFAAVWAVLGGRRLDERAATPAGWILAAISLALAVGLPLSWLIGLSREVGAFERALALAGMLGLLCVPLLSAALQPASGLRAWLRESVGGGFASRGELVLLGLILLLFGLVVVRLILVNPVFGFDESIYALTARWWIEGTPNSGWAAHRPPGISVLGILGLPFGTLEAPFRVIGLLSGLGALVACWRLGRELAGPAAGLIAALCVATILDLQLNAAAFLTDVPSAALVVVLMLVAWRRFTSPAGPVADRAVLLLAPIAAVTFYIRYGAAVPIAFLVLATMLLWPRRVARMWRPLLVTAVLLLVLLAPHLIYATSLGSPWSIVLGSRNLAAPAYVGQALEIYVGQFFSTVAGPIAGGVAAIGLIAATWQIARRPRPERATRLYLFLLIPALGSGLLLGLLTLPQTRYVYVPIMLLVIAGAVGLAASWRRLPAVLHIGSAALAAAIVSVVVLNVGSSMIASQAAYARTQRDVVVAAERIRADALAHSPDGDPDCSVLTYLVPEVTWYSGCSAVHFDYPAVAGRETLLSGPNRYLMLVTGAPGVRQPQGAMLEDYLRLVDSEPIAVVRDLSSGRVAVRIYRFSSSPPA
jgi:hypothetical protein